MTARLWTNIVLVSCILVPATIVGQNTVLAQSAKKKADWRPATAAAKKAPVKATKTANPAPLAASDSTAPQTEPVQADASSSTPVPTPASSPPVIDQSEEVLNVDFALAASIASQGPKLGYGSAISDEGVLYDANSVSPTGQEAANARFGNFPADVKLVRAPERALAAGGSGSSWGTYAIKRGESVLSSGRYISVWRRETMGWKMISELAAGKTIVPPPPSAISGVLPKRPPSPARPVQSPVGIPLTVPTLPTSTPSQPAQPTPPTP